MTASFANAPVPGHQRSAPSLIDRMKAPESQAVRSAPRTIAAARATYVPVEVDDAPNSSSVIAVVGDVAGVHVERDRVVRRPA